MTKPNDNDQFVIIDEESLPLTDVQWAELKARVDARNGQWFLCSRQPALTWAPTEKPTIATTSIEAPPCVKDHEGE